MTVLQGVFNQAAQLTSLSFGEVRLNRPWGIEFSDSKSFYSRAPNGWGFTESVDRGSSSQDSEHCYRESVVKTPLGEFSLITSDDIEGNVVLRELTLVALRPSKLVDLVSRFVFDPSLIQSVKLAGNDIPLDESNTYHQYETSVVEIRGREFEANVRIANSEIPDSMVPTMYARSSPFDGLVVHARCIPESWTGESVRVLGRRLPDSLASGLTAIPGVASKIRYASERNRRIGRIMQGMPYVQLETGDTLRLETCFEVES